MEHKRIEETAQKLRALQRTTLVPQTDYSGFRTSAERMTERLIDALFPNYAAGSPR